MKLLGLVFCLALVTIASSRIPKCEEVAQMKEDIRKEFVSKNFHPGALRLGNDSGAPQLSLTKYFRYRFWRVSLTKIRKTCMQSGAIDLRPVPVMVLQKG